MLTMIDYFSQHLLQRLPENDPFQGHLLAPKGRIIKARGNAPGNEVKITSPGALIIRPFLWG
ncbi:MAG: hypothetical protein DRR19_01060 [Candidatus Parabeggiatoa sp. nov. 1]|nr:MAG: hypothetical protein DRR19_01060 [Gammaproteobacteria bacterium]